MPKVKFLAQTNYGEEGVLLQMFNFMEEKTVYTMLGDVISKVGILILSVLLVLRIFLSEG